MSAQVCAVCRRELQPWFERFDREVWHCGACGHIQVPDGVAVRSDGSSIYEGDTDLFQGETNVEYYLDEGTADAARGKLDFVARYAKPRGTLLDVGASFGHFLDVARHHHDAYGLELNPAAVRWSRTEFGARNFVGSVYDVPREIPLPVDVVTAWDVIEHLADPRAALLACRQCLTDNGWLFLSTPDAGALTAQLMGRHWYYQDPVQHINLFSRRNLTALLTEIGFEVVAHTYFGRRYRVNYVLQRLRYLLGEHGGGRVINPLLRLPAPVRNSHVTIKLWDVMGLAARGV